MGAKQSKQDAPGAFEWKASGPPKVSLDLIEKLQSNAETDASRTRLFDQHVQMLVADELKRQGKRETEVLREAHDKIAAAAALVAEKKGDKDGGPSHSLVSQEVEALWQKLDERKKVRDLPEAVDKARNEVVRCLRENDRRPLDCWQEVQRFKAEVKGLEKKWVDKVAS
ncbi:hypothetical protein CDD81_1493 [Ophiocordyceps australis]|uniref:Altered inheritance of mitochondria protein 13, mitochondrial n=1 Tax=Ophiocordyceps australis TaxID=1399860 RepID=A0A2C5YDI5_9HYPO|nr:hypothetical protein CDD81_1493 [Ophiocordyceps australis]